ncbi:hypothetical protein JMG10_02665 [Nostoc ellipsosporum NOK]|nr:hypothetical protein [Nostoc ellipsosporum NOK]
MILLASNLDIFKYGPTILSIKGDLRCGYFKRRCDILSVRLSNGYFIHLGWSINTNDGSTYQHLRIFHEKELGKEDKE